MFGRRPDGRVLRRIDPIVALTPYLMPMRCDAQVMLDLQVDYEKMARYIVQKGTEGYRFSFMELFFAAFVRTASQMPDLNRFIANKRTYARTELTISFAVLKETADGSVQENVAKCKFDPRDTIYDVAARTHEAVLQCRKEEADNITMKFAEALKLPLLANLVVGLARLLDRYGILPKAVIDASPFHTSMFCANMASIGMPAVKHHIYNFGTTSLFVSIGNIERTITLNSKGEAQRKRMLPLGVVADERVCAGMVYAQMVSKFKHYLSNPELLEVPPEEVRFNEDNVYSMPPAPKRRRFRMPLRRKKKRDSSAA